MKQRSNDWIVGATILVVMVGIVFSTLFLQQAEFGKKPELVTAHFRDVGGVQVGNAVVIRGVVAGRVKQIALAPNDWVLISMELNEGTLMPADPVVLVQAATLFGEWQAIITSRTAVPVNREVETQLAEVDGAPEGSLRGAVLPDIAQLTTVAGGIAGNIASVSERVRTAFNDSAARELRRSIRDFSILSRDLATAVKVQSRNLDSLAVSARLSFADVASSANALQRTMARVDSATAQGEVQEILRQSRQASQNLRNATERFESLSRSLVSAEANLRGAIGKADTILARVERGQGSLGLLVNDPSLYRNSDSLLVDLRKLVVDFRSDPKKYINVRVF